MLASPGNHQLPTFVSRYPHWEAYKVNALTCPLEDIETCYANPPLDVDRKMVESFEGEPSPQMHDDSPPLGFNHMVAPTSETARQGSTLFQDPPVSRDVPQLPREKYEGASLAPDLHLVIGKKLEAQQISSDSRNLYLASIKSIDRYNRAFWSFAFTKATTPSIYS